MSESTRIFFHAAYVAFAFGCLLFGALAYRQLLENMAVRRVKAGEDRRHFTSAPATWILIALLAFNGIVAMLCYNVDEPSIYMYALPLVLLVQNIQIALRIRFQRTVAKTKGIVVRSTLLERVRVAWYGEVIDIKFAYEPLWVKVTLDVLPEERITFRIFRGSAPALAQILQAACVSPIRRTGRGAPIDPTTTSTQP
ncbi:MAG: hypothetical protein FGM24_03435 [Candidatus Kapabacteria bacterium]|nr:hypothetical protein [Candidatus Kapabacteria bacterium]